MRIVYFGSGEFGLPSLQHLARHHELLAVVSQPDRPAGRHRHLTPTPIAAWAADQGLPLLKTPDVNAPDFIRQVQALKPQAGVVIAFGQKLNADLVAALGSVALNLHASLLPLYRGAAPINWAILNGEKQTGVSVISLDQRMDAGLVYAQIPTPIDPMETAGELHDRLAQLGPQALQQVLDAHQAGTLAGQAQDESRVTQAPKLHKDQGHLNFNATAQEIQRRVHGLTPWPGVSVTWDRADGKCETLILLRVKADSDFTLDAPPGSVLADHYIATRDGAVKLLEVQLPGANAMNIETFAHGHQLKSGDILRGPMSQLPDNPPPPNA